MAGLSERMKKHVLTLLTLRKILWTAKKTNEWSKDTVKARKYEEARERDNARNVGEKGCALDNIKMWKRAKTNGESDQLSDRGRLKNRTEPVVRVGHEKW